MKILYWTERFWPHTGGVETFSESLIPQLQQAGHQFCVVTSHSSAELADTATFNDIPIHRFHFLTALTNKNLARLIQARKRLAQLKQTFQPDLVHIHFSGPSSLFHWQTAKAWPAPTLITFHSVPNQLKQANSLLTNTLKNASWVNTVSQFMLDDLRALEPSIAEKSSVIYNGIEFPASGDRPPSKTPQKLLCIGRLVDWKGFDLAIRAFAIVAKKASTLQLVIAGDGPARPQLEQLATELGVKESVAFLGWVSREDLPTLYAESTAVLIPSHADENLPVVAIEAGMSARPVIASKISGLPEIILDGQTGYLTTPNDAADIADKLSMLLDLTPQVRERMGQQAIAEMHQRFSFDSCVQQYQALYQQLSQPAS